MYKYEIDDMIVEIVTGYTPYELFEIRSRTMPLTPDELEIVTSLRKIYNQLCHELPINEIKGILETVANDFFAMKEMEKAEQEIKNG